MLRELGYLSILYIGFLAKEDSVYVKLKIAFNSLHWILKPPGNLTCLLHSTLTFNSLHWILRILETASPTPGGGAFNSLHWIH